jgi:hypothetical protein
MAVLFRLKHPSVYLALTGVNVTAVAWHRKLHDMPTTGVPWPEPPAGLQAPGA